MRLVVGSKYIRFVQALNLVGLIIWLFISILIYWMDDNINTLVVVIAGTFFFGLVNILYLMVFEITILDNEISVRNLFRRNKLSRQCFKRIEKAFLSPMLYKIMFSDDKVYYFAINSDLVFKILLGQKNEDEMIKDWTKPLGTFTAT